MRTQITKISKIVLLTFIMCAMVFSTNAQIKNKNKYNLNTSTTSMKKSKWEGCEQVILKKSGVVHSVGPAVLKFFGTSHEATIHIKKTGGRAPAQVNVYVCGILRDEENQQITFLNGKNTTPYHTIKLKKVKGCPIRVEIVNQSVGNTFKYTAKILVKSRSLLKGPNTKGGGGDLLGQGKSTFFITKSCTGKTKIIIERNGGRARATLIIYEQNSNGSYNSKLIDETILNDQRTETIELNTNKKLKIEIKNISIGKSLKFHIDAIAKL